MSKVLKTSAADLPRPDVSVSKSTNSNGDTSITIIANRDGKSRSWNGVGKSDLEAIRDVAKKILDDPVTAEMLP
jgi:hypothetical protein